jgi:hypothetical protein
MYTVSDAVEMGNARELVLSSVKREEQFDDIDPTSLPGEEYFDE